MDHFRGDLPSEDHVLTPVPDEGYAVHDQNEEGHGLHAAGGSHRRSSDEHEDASQEAGALPQALLGHRRKARRSEGDGLEEAVHGLAAEGHIPDGLGIVVFQTEDDQGAGQDQRNGKHQNQLRMFIEMLANGPEGIFPLDPPAEIPEDIDPDHVAETAHHDQHHGVEKHQRTVLITDQTVRSQDIDPRITEGGNRREDRVPDPLSHAIGGDEGDHVDQRSYHFHHEGAFKDRDQKPPDTVHGIQIEGIMDQQGLGQRQLLIYQQHQDRGNRDDPEAAQLDQDQDHDLPEQAPVGKCVHHHQSRHADGRGGREECGGHVRTARPLLRYGEHEEQRPDDDRPQETERDQLLGFQFSLLLLHPTVSTSKSNVMPSCPLSACQLSASFRAIPSASSTAQPVRSRKKLPA